MKESTTKCSTKGCKVKTYKYRDKCLKCLPKQKSGPKSRGERKSYLAKLSKEQQEKLTEHFGGSIQVLIDAVL